MFGSNGKFNRGVGLGFEGGQGDMRILLPFEGTVHATVGAQSTSSAVAIQLLVERGVNPEHAAMVAGDDVLEIDEDTEIVES